MVKKLAQILTDLPVIALHGNSDKTLTGLTFDSRKAEKGMAFFAIKGTISDGHNFIEAAIENGTEVVVCEQLPENRPDHCTFVVVENSAYSLALSAASFFDHPSKKLTLVGVTGTNGKTTIVTLLHQLFQDAGYAAGLLSTICNKIGSKTLAATHTTPDPISINALLNEMVLAGCTYAFMEVSSHAMVQMRTFGLYFSGGIFSNLTHDHLDYHGSFAAYRDAKKLFFDLLTKDAFALVNVDDKNGMYMTQNTRAKIKTFSLQNVADYKARILENHFEGLMLSIEGHEIFTRLIGQFNASNLLAIYAAADLLGLPKLEILTGISRLQSAEGRFEWMRSDDGITGIVDYAHTPDALLNVLKTIDTIRTHQEQLITVAGAGGNRDATKRPIMAQIAAQWSNILILTSDNPRNEDPQAILEEMRKGLPVQHFKKHLVIADRKEAIKTAVLMAKAGDIILVAGKGHEKYQEINGVRHPFDDKEILYQLLQSTPQNI